MGEPLEVTLLASEKQAVTDPVNGEGGFQNLLRGLQDRLDGNTLILHPIEVERIHRYADEYGQGGFQDRFTLIAAAIRRARCTG